jgi:HSP20 family protein
MNLVRWNNMNDLWRTRYANDTARPVLRPAMDVVENDGVVNVRLNLPGVNPDDVNIEIDGDLLTISGELGDTVEQEGDQFYYRERCQGAFKRSLRVDDTIDTEHAEATFENGVLTLSLPKLPEAQPKRIKVATS